MIPYHKRIHHLPVRQSGVPFLSHIGSIATLHMSCHSIYMSFRYHLSPQHPNFFSFFLFFFGGGSRLPTIQKTPPHTEAKDASTIQPRRLSNPRPPPWERKGLTTRLHVLQTQHPKLKITSINFQTKHTPHNVFISIPSPHVPSCHLYTNCNLTCHTSKKASDLSYPSCALL